MLMLGQAELMWGQPPSAVRSSEARGMVGATAAARRRNRRATRFQKCPAQSFQGPCWRSERIAEASSWSPAPPALRAS